MSSPEQAALQAAFTALNQVQATKYTYVAAMTIMLYDISITFKQEVKTVWFARSSIGKWLFLVNRYVAPILFTFDLNYQLTPGLSVNVCQNAFLPPSLLGIISLTAVEFILVLRTFALYPSKILLFSLSFMCMAASATMMATTIVMYNQYIAFTEPTFPTFQVGCSELCSDSMCRKLLTTFWIPFFALETVIFILTFWKSYRSTLGLTGSGKLVQIFYRDGFAYYAVIMSISITNLLVWVRAPLALAYVATSLMRSLQVTVSSRILLNIRGIMEVGYGTSMTQMSSLHFKAAAPARRAPHDTLDDSIMLETFSESAPAITED
ncbi:hypothetical protein C8J56DRAFT_1170907 [Mycena floridula]|nr:hypothetical protein C8J56DRAFT_1170907 [Mycena floridula]